VQSLCQAKREQKKNRRNRQKKRIQDPWSPPAVTATWTPPEHPLKFTPIYQLCGLSSPALAPRGRFRDVRAVTCMVHITRLDLDQISMPRSDGSLAVGMPFSRVPQVRGDTHAADKCHRRHQPDHCSTLACRCLSGECKARSGWT
jgi:hypothetical protein